MGEGLRFEDGIDPLELLSDIRLFLDFFAFSPVFEAVVLLRLFLEEGDSFALNLGLWLVDFGMPVEYLLEVVSAKIRKIFDEINHDVMLG